MVSDREEDGALGVGLTMGTLRLRTHRHPRDDSSCCPIDGACTHCLVNAPVPFLFHNHQILILNIGGIPIDDNLGRAISC